MKQIGLTVWEEVFVISLQESLNCILGLILPEVLKNGPSIFNLDITGIIYNNNNEQILIL